MVYAELKKVLRDYNWDDEFETPQRILDDPNCDLAPAFEIFYLADGDAYLDNPSAGMKGDPDVEQFFIDYLVDLDPVKQYRSTGSDVLSEIPDSFWE